MDEHDGSTNGVEGKVKTMEGSTWRCPWYGVGMASSVIGKFPRTGFLGSYICMYIYIYEILINLITINEQKYLNS